MMSTTSNGKNKISDVMILCSALFVYKLKAGSRFIIFFKIIINCLIDPIDKS